MPTDKFDLPFLYPTKSTAGLTNTGPAFFYQQSNDIRNDEEVKGMVERSGGGGISNVNTTTGEFTANHESSDSFTINKDPSFTSSIGGCNMNFAQTAARGYAYQIDQPRDIELKFLCKFLDASATTGLSISGPTGRHNESPCSQGFTYMFSIEDLGSNPCFYRFRKETYHVNYDTDPKTGNFTHPLMSLDLTNTNRFLGFAYVRYNKKDGVAPGKDSVIIEGWFNPDPAADKNNWIMMKRTEDTGGWGDGASQFGAENDWVIGTWSNAVFRIKASDATITYKNITLREIDPTKSFDDEPEAPGPGEQPTNTQTIQGNFTLKWDLNTSRTSVCAPASAGTIEFYSVNADFERILSDSTTHDNRIRVGQTVTNSSVPQSLYGKLVQEMEVPMKKAGTPAASPVVSAKIWDSAGTVLYTSPTTINPTTLTTSFVDKAFDFSTNTHILATGDIIGVEYTGINSTNYVVVGYTEPSVITNSKYITFHNDGTGWEDTSTRDFACTLYE